MLIAGKGSSSGVGFAIPIDTVKGLVDQILQYGQVMRPALGIVLAPPQTLASIGQKGVLILEVSAGQALH
jgi:S1-C subfamily serine protease